MVKAGSSKKNQAVAKAAIKKKEEAEVKVVSRIKGIVIVVNYLIFH